MRQLPKLSTDDRTLNRYVTEIPVALREGSSCYYKVSTVDISCCGCRLHLGYTATAGQVVTLYFAGFAPVRATIIWSADRQAGVKFVNAFHLSVLRHLIAASTPIVRSSYPST
ncbi:PilZ domain-containing protein [Sphingomonas faeni]|uniref:PilZ domain-containing protein n=1 Tax=Sphingomonas faeni TaxID=185950 RepID=UPI0033606406